MQTPLTCFIFILISNYRTDAPIFESYLSEPFPGNTKTRLPMNGQSCSSQSFSIL